MKQPVWTLKWLKNQQVRTRAWSDDSDLKSTGTAQSASNTTAKRGKCSQPKDHTYLNATIWKHSRPSALPTSILHITKRGRHATSFNKEATNGHNWNLPTQWKEFWTHPNSMDIQSKELSNEQIDCEVDTGAGCNIIGLNQAKKLCKQEWLALAPPTVKIKAFGGSVVHVLGSITIFLHVGNKTFKALCQVTNTDDCHLMGRTVAKAMGYINYPDIEPPTKSKQNMHKLKWTL